MRIKPFYILGLVLILALASGTVLAASVTPDVIPGGQNTDKTCAVVFPGTLELKIEPVPDGTYPATDGVLSVTVDKPSTEGGTNSFDWSANIPVEGVIVKDGNDGANVYDYPTPGSMGDTYLTTPNDGDKGISHISFCYIPFVPDGELLVSKTAFGEWDRDVEWKLEKSVDKDTHTGEAGDEFSSTWTVTATKTDSGPYDFIVYGEITITNKTNMQVTFDVVDVLDDATVAEVICEKTTLAIDESTTCTYEALPKNASAENNTATVTVTATLPGDFTDYFDPPPSAKEEIEWKENLTGYDEGTLSDERFDYEELISESTTETFPEKFECSANANDYTNGTYSYTETNTAVLNDSIDLEASATVTVECTLPALVVSKTAAGIYDRTVDWELEKSVDPASHSGEPGDEFWSTWKVTATKTEKLDNYKVKSTITIDNPAKIAQSFTVEDVLDDDTVAEVTCPAYTVPAEGKVECTYVATPVDDSATENKATVTAIGNPDQTATAEVKWTENLIGYDEGTLSDERFGFSEKISTTTTKTFEEKFVCSTAREDYGEGGYYTYTEKNTAVLNDNINLDASAEVTVECTAGFVDIIKTTNGVVDPTKDIKFDLWSGTDYFETIGTFGDEDGKLEFQTALVPGEKYTVCEAPVPAGYTFEISVDSGAVETYAGPPDASNPTGEIQCFDFVAQEKETLTFNVNNRYPGGAPRTPGYWKNWNRCTGGNQAATADILNDYLGPINGAGVWLLDDLLPKTVGKLEISTCPVGVYVLDTRWAVGKQAGKQASSDAGYELARNYFAALLNKGAGACQPEGEIADGKTFDQILAAAQELLIKIGYDGDGDLLTPKSKSPDRATALRLAGILDNYNNSMYCTGEESH